MNPGEEFSGKRRQLTMARILALSGGALGSAEWPRKNLHTDGAKAAEAGLAAPIASGIQCEGDMVRLLVQLFGDRWFREGKLNVTHRRPVFEGTWIQAHARVSTTSPAAGGNLVELEVWCETPEKVVLSAGTATCIHESQS